ncbi:CFI-box-CTERM domain-containing protein [Chloroflexota bacterium]
MRSALVSVSVSGGNGTSVNITGTNFTGATAVKFGGTDASSFNIDLSTQIAVTVGSGSTGPVTVTTPGGMATSTDNFTYISSECFIATAAYGSYLDSHVNTLRNFRDEYLTTNSIGRSLVFLYYDLSPPVAEFIDEHPALKPVVRVGLLPTVAMSTVAINTTPGEKIAVVGLSVLVSLALVAWLRKRRVKDLQHY